MKRRKFVKNLSTAAATPIALNGLPIRILGSDNVLNRMAANSSNNRVLIILQLIGGNDALNTFIPVKDYDQYLSNRPSLAIPKSGNRSYIPLDSTVDIDAQVGLHPDMTDFKDLYDSGKAAIFQSVGYENMSGSHFRGTDIVFQGIDGLSGDEDSGWLGRFIGSELAPLQFPDDFPSDDNPHPIALEMGSGTSGLLLHTGAVPTSVAIGDSPDEIAKIINTLDGFGESDDVLIRGKAPEFLDGTFYNDELDAILAVENQTELYFQRITEVYDNSTETTVEYPTEYPFETPRRKENPLSAQLKLIARLLAGGIQTKVFRVTIGGFDTHANQVLDGDPTMGTHAALLYHVSSAMKAFQRDLAMRGLEERVMTVSISEFGRRIKENGSHGTAHGRGGSVMLFGTGINPGIYGNTPDLSQNNIDYQLDYRQVYANILHEWMGVSRDRLANEVFFRDFIAGPDPRGGNFAPLNILSGTVLTTHDHLNKNYHIKRVYPNPANRFTKIEIFVNNIQNIQIDLLSVEGKKMTTTKRRVLPGSHSFQFHTVNLPQGLYLIKVLSEKLNESKWLWVRH
ncbi:MAG: DUF1501 domain-containing protein [Bacteroidota bacterium]